MRQSKLVGAAGMGPGGLLGGTGGSRTPMPVCFRGGPLPRANDACGSGSDSYSVNSYGTLKMLLRHYKSV
jgi:hypothetical protein